MFALVLFFAVAFGQGDQFNPANIKYVVKKQDGVYYARDITECTFIGKNHVKIVPVTETTFDVGGCPKEGETFQKYQTMTLADFEPESTECKFVEDLRFSEDYVAYEIQDQKQGCSVDWSKEIIIYTTQCSPDEEGSFKYSFDSEKNAVIRHIYEDASCNGDEDDSIEISCGECIETVTETVNAEGKTQTVKTYNKINCEEYKKENHPLPSGGDSGNQGGDNGQGGNGGQGGKVPDTSMCDASYATKYKYMISGEGLMTVRDLSKCYPLPVIGEGMFIPCNDANMIIGSCSTDGSNSVPMFVQEFTDKWSETFPSHNVHLIAQPDDKCTTTTSAEIKAFKINECVEDYKKEGQYMKGQLDGDKMKFKYYSDDKCNTAVEGEGATGEATCDTCDDKNFKLVCHEYGKQPKDESSGSIVTFLLMAFALIFFLF